MLEQLDEEIDVDAIPSPVQVSSPVPQFTAEEAGVELINAKYTACDSVLSGVLNTFYSMLYYAAFAGVLFSTPHTLNLWIFKLVPKLHINLKKLKTATFLT